MGRDADVIDLASHRRAPVGQMPLALFLPGFEFWFTPAQAEELAADLRAMAAAARVERPRPRGA